MNQKFDIIELESTIRPFESEAKRIQKTINAVGIQAYKDNMERLAEERVASGMCLNCGSAIRGGKCLDCE